MIRWKDCKKILCIRADNMGDIVMTTPALRALKESFGASLTVLTSGQGEPICSSIAEIDDILVADLPWVRLNHQFNANKYQELVETIRSLSFDAAVIFTVYSQSALPAALLCFQAEIPLRLAYSRENPYNLLTDWVADVEPYRLIKHQVERDIDLVRSIGAAPNTSTLSIKVVEAAAISLEQKLSFAGIYLSGPYLIFHTGVSEEKREYPAEMWEQAIKEISRLSGRSILLTGSPSEKQKVGRLFDPTLPEVYNVAGLISVEELVVLIRDAECVVSVNTAIVHIAAALNTPVVVLYAMTNPQHTPWQVPHRLLPFSVPEALKSKNEVIKHVDELLYTEYVPYPSVELIANAVSELIQVPS